MADMFYNYQWNEQRDDEQIQTIDRNSKDIAANIVPKDQQITPALSSSYTREQLRSHVQDILAHGELSAYNKAYDNHRILWNNGLRALVNQREEVDAKVKTHLGKIDDASQQIWEAFADIQKVYDNDSDLDSLGDAFLEGLAQHENAINNVGRAIRDGAAGVFHGIGSAYHKLFG